MNHFPHIRYLTAASLAVLGSCAAPRALIVELPKEKKVSATSEGNEVLPTSASRAVQDGIRLPDNITSMPSDTDFRSTTPVNAATSSGAVIVRPPTDPVIPPEMEPKTE